MVCGVGRECGRGGRGALDIPVSSSTRALATQRKSVFMKHPLLFVLTFCFFPGRPRRIRSQPFLGALQHVAYFGWPRRALIASPPSSRFSSSSSPASFRWNEKCGFAALACFLPRRRCSNGDGRYAGEDVDGQKQFGMSGRERTKVLYPSMPAFLSSRFFFSRTDLNSARSMSAQRDRERWARRPACIRVNQHQQRRNNSNVYCTGAPRL